jgi:hypothetical protein
VISTPSAAVTLVTPMPPPTAKMTAANAIKVLMVYLVEE